MSAEVYDSLTIGTKVIAYNVQDLEKAEGEVIVPYDEDRIGKPVGIKLKNRHPKAHACDGACEEGYGWWVTSDDVVIAN